MRLKRYKVEVYLSNVTTNPNITLAQKMTVKITLSQTGQFGTESH